MTKLTVHLVDDHPAVCHGLREMLSGLGYEVETFGSALQFLKVLDRLGPGCVVADVRMPGMDGLQLMHELVQRSIRLPVVLISGHADVQMAVAAIKAGAEDLIKKPIKDTEPDRRNPSLSHKGGRAAVPWAIDRESGTTVQQAHSA